jgi:hypothetical protein
MPRYVIELHPAAAAQADATRLVMERFPEIAIEERYTSRDSDVRTELWICRAPSETHLRRWADAAALTVHGLRRIEHTVTPDHENPTKGTSR